MTGKSVLHGSAGYTTSSKNRLGLENFNTTYPNWPFALVRLGRAYLLLEDLQGALEQFETALRLLSPVQDDKFARYVEGLRAYIKVTILPFRNAWLIGGFLLEH